MIPKSGNRFSDKIMLKQASASPDTRTALPRDTLQGTKCLPSSKNSFPS